MAVIRVGGMGGGARWLGGLTMQGGGVYQAGPAAAPAAALVRDQGGPKPAPRPVVASLGRAAQKPVVASLGRSTAAPVAAAPMRGAALTLVAPSVVAAPLRPAARALGVPAVIAPPKPVALVEAPPAVVHTPAEIVQEAFSTPIQGGGNGLAKNGDTVAPGSPAGAELTQTPGPVEAIGAAVGVPGVYLVAGGVSLAVGLGLYLVLR